MGKHPVSTQIDPALNKEVDDYCKGKCSKYQFIREAIREKMEKVKNERTKESERHSERATRQVTEGTQRNEGETEPINDLNDAYAPAAS